VRSLIDELRPRLANGELTGEAFAEGPFTACLAEALAQAEAPKLRRVFNLTGEYPGQTTVSCNKNKMLNHALKSDPGQRVRARRVWRASAGALSGSL
jgi:hypothetical protein